jgi:hypothetical protein
MRFCVPSHRLHSPAAFSVGTLYDDEGTLRFVVLSLFFYDPLKNPMLYLKNYSLRYTAYTNIMEQMAIPAAAQSKVWVCGHSLVGIAGSNPAGGMDVCLLWVLCVVIVEVSASGWSLVQRSPTECGVSECDREASIIPIFQISLQMHITTKWRCEREVPVFTST